MSIPSRSGLYNDKSDFPRIFADALYGDVKSSECSEKIDRFRLRAKLLNLTVTGARDIGNYLIQAASRSVRRIQCQLWMICTIRPLALKTDFIRAIEPSRRT